MCATIPPPPPLPPPPFLLATSAKNTKTVASSLCAVRVKMYIVLFFRPFFVHFQAACMHTCVHMAYMCWHMPCTFLRDDVDNKCIN